MLLEKYMKLGKIFHGSQAMYHSDRIQLFYSGIIQMADGSWKQFDMVPEEYEVREGQADYTGRVCVIGTDLKEEDLIKLFHI